ncbi:hypothetical protein HT031_004717 [Scenedesmus sp. PABB004]|nr:hypothetical protein HT031_004717 [Scenedesmus sp. PABB004]
MAAAAPAAAPDDAQPDGAAQLREFLAEAQDDIERLQAALAAARRDAASTASASRAQLAAAAAALAAARDGAAARQQAAGEAQTQLEAARAAAAAARGELRRSEAASAARLAALAADLDAARSAERAALADAKRARSAQAARARQLQDAEAQLSQHREQAGIHSELSRLQLALMEQKRRDADSAAAAAAAAAGAAKQREQQASLQAELESYKVMLAEAQAEVARLEGDSRQLAALRRSRAGTPVPGPLPASDGAAPALLTATSCPTEAGPVGGGSGGSSPPDWLRSPRSRPVTPAAGDKQQAQQELLGRLRARSSRGGTRASLAADAGQLQGARPRAASAAPAGCSPGRPGLAAAAPVPLHAALLSPRRPPALPAAGPVPATSGCARSGDAPP